MRGVPSRRRRRAREGAHPLVRDRARAGDDARIGRIRAQDASLFRRPRAQATSAPKMQVRFGEFGLTYGQFGFGYSGLAEATVGGYTKMACSLCLCSMFTSATPCGFPTPSKEIGPWM